MYFISVLWISFLFLPRQKYTKTNPISLVVSYSEGVIVFLDLLDNFYI